MKPKLIKTKADYEAALQRIEEIFDAVPGTPEGDELELLSMLMETYEEKTFPIDLPDPLAAIRFRMDQQGLKPKDLVPYFGSASKVSEVLSGHRSLSLSMIRNLVNELGIPAEVLLQKPGAGLDADLSATWKRFPLAEMIKRQWFPGFTGTLTEAREQAEDLIRALATPLGFDSLKLAFNRQHVRSGSHADEAAMTAWRIRVGSLAVRESLPAYRKGIIKQNVLSELARLSYLDEGPRLAREFLQKNGIHFVVERHLPRTFLDGGAFRLPDGAPLVALTLRYDRLDHFWFTLFHELAHVALHLDSDRIDACFDDLCTANQEEFEQEADRFAREALIPAKEWSKSRLAADYTVEKVRRFASQLRISPAIPAGRIRYEHKNYKILQDLVGHGGVRKLFSVTRNYPNFSSC